jgi:predicted MPP superfamily phosphohydrolase
MISSYLYNASVGILVVLAVWVIFHTARDPAQPPLWRRIAMVVALLGALMVILGIGLESNGFGYFRLWCWGIFVHLSLFAFASAIVLARKSWRWSAFGSLVGILLVAIGIDAFFIEPTWLEVTHHQLVSDKLTKPLKIVVIADLQTDHIGDYERRVLREVKAQQPDLILWAGDYLQEHRPGRWEPLHEELRALLAEIDLQPPLGSYAVGGNVDDRRWPQLFADTPVEAFPETRTVTRADVTVTGLATRESFDPDASVPAQEKFHIVLGHCPNFALGDVNADLLVAGHVHGGQVRLPGIGPLLTLADVPRRWAVGLTELAPGKTLAVSRGIGMERSNAPRLRFLCRPELMVLHVSPVGGPVAAAEGELP